MSQAKLVECRCGDLQQRRLFWAWSRGLGSVVRDCALTCHVGYRHAPIAFLIVAALSFPFVALQIRMQKRWGQETWRVRSTLLIAMSLLLFRFVLTQLRGESGPGRNRIDRVLCRFLSGSMWPSC